MTNKKKVLDSCIEINLLNQMYIISALVYSDLFIKFLNAASYYIAQFDKVYDGNLHRLYMNS